MSSTTPQFPSDSPQPQKPNKRSQVASVRIVRLKSESSFSWTSAFVLLSLVACLCAGIILFVRPKPTVPVIVAKEEQKPVVALPKIVINPEKSDAPEYVSSNVFPPPDDDTTEEVSNKEVTTVAKEESPKTPVVSYKTKLPGATSIQENKTPSALDREVWEKLSPSRKKPLILPEPADRAQLAALIDRYTRIPAKKVVANPLASDFPGAVPDGAPRVVKVIQLPARVSGWQSTGVYAPPGAVVRVRLSSKDVKRGLRVQIGCHTDQLFMREDTRVMLRFPALVRSEPVVNQETIIANSFGGPIYILTPGADEKDKSRIHVEISGGVEAPFFRLGETTPKEWEHLRNAPAPWGELVCRNIALTVPSSELRKLDDPEKLLRLWEKIIDAQDWLAVLPRRETHPERIVPDVQIVGYMHSGYPVMCHINPSAGHMVDYNNLTTNGDWGFFHEFGHNRQVGEWTFSGYGEVTCNLFALYCMETIAGKPVGRGEGGLAKELAEKLADPAGNGGPFHLLSIYVPVLREFGWESLRNTFAEYKKPDTVSERRMKERIARSHAKVTRSKSKRKEELLAEMADKADDLNKEKFVRLWSKHTKHNLLPYFEKVGFPASQSLKSKLSSLPRWLPPEAKENQ